MFFLPHITNRSYHNNVVFPSPYDEDFNNNNNNNSPSPHLRFSKHGLYSPHRRRRLRAPRLQRPPTSNRRRRRRSRTARYHQRALIAAAATAAAVERRPEGERRQPPGVVGAGRGSGDGQEEGVIALVAKRGRASSSPATWWDASERARVGVGEVSGFGEG